MSLTIIKTPARQALRCATEGEDLCAAISDSDFIFTWTMDVATQTLTSVKVEPNPNGLISSFSSVISGTVQPVLGSTTALNYDASTGLFTPPIEYSLTQDAFYSISVEFNVVLTDGTLCTGTSASDVEQFIGSGALPVAAPTILGLPVVGETLTGLDNYSDADGDLQDTGATVRRWYRYDDSAATTGELLLGSGSTYVVSASDEGKFITYKVIPAALSGLTPGVEASSASTGPIVDDTEVFVLTSKKSATQNISLGATIGTTFGIDWGDGSTFELVTTTTTTTLFTHSYADTTVKTITFYGDPTTVTSFEAADEEIATADFTDLTSLASINLSNSSASPTLTSVTMPVGNTATWTSIQMFRCSGLTSLDITGLPSLPTQLTLFGSSSLTTLSLPSSGTCTNLRINSCNLTGSLDFTGMDLSDRVDISSNPNLNSVTFGTSTGNTDDLVLFNCNLTGAIDISMFTLTGQVLLQNNVLTSISLPTTTQTATSFSASGNDLSSLDLTYMTSLSTITVQNNTGMTSITYPSSTTSLRTLRADGCDLGFQDVSGLTFTTSSLDVRFHSNSMTTAEVNCTLESLATAITASGTGTIAISANSAPDSSSGGCDGEQAAIDLAALDYTVTTD